MSAQRPSIWRQETPLGVFWAAWEGEFVVASGFGEPRHGWTHETRGAAYRAVRLALAGWLAGAPEAFVGLPIAPPATAFQRAVFAATAAVPFGTTVSYGDLATRIGRPRGAQAVGQALARNPCLLLVPCHRVVPAAGGLGGYAGGAGLKAALLAHEARLGGLSRGDRFWQGRCC